MDSAEEARVQVQPPVCGRVHPGRLSAEGGSDASGKVRAEGNAEASGDVGMGKETVASEGVVRVGGRVEGRGKGIVVRKVKEA